MRAVTVVLFCVGFVLLLISDETSGKPVNVTINSLADKDDKLVQFLFKVMADYPDWLNYQSVDPTEPIAEPFSRISDDWSSSKVKVNLTVQNVYMEGHSNSDLYDFIEVDARYRRDKPDYRYLEAQIHINGLIFGGDYIVNGNVIDKNEETGETIQIPLSASGKWKIKTDIKLSNRYTNLILLDDDRFDFAGKLPSVTAVPKTNPEDIDFEGVLDGNELLKLYEEAIKRELSGLYTWTLWQSDKSPSAKLFAKFAEKFRGYYGFSLA